MPASPLYKLPNGLVIHHHRGYETDFVYREVFVEQIYTKAFPDLPVAPCIVDVGANIGLFSLWIKQRFPDATIYAFEPSPVHCHLCEQNFKNLSDVHLFQQGLGEMEMRKTFTYYPNYSLLSGFHGNTSEDRNLLSAGIAQQLHLDTTENNEANNNDTDKYVELLIDNKLDSAEQFDCTITTLSTVIAQQAIKQIDLLKIDAEKAELDVLKGIANDDWGKIRHIVLEAHHQQACNSVCALLEQKGYQVKIEKSADFKNTAIFNVYARR